MFVNTFNELAIIPGFQGPGELGIILLVILLLFGSAKLPKLARSLGQSINEFKKGKEEIARELKKGAEDVKAEADEIKDVVDS
ncbi:MAG: sec-independent protein translocase protein TatA [Kiritimatiellia bacterium]|jgi:sec-independent protein translocase protein TatA